MFLHIYTNKKEVYNYFFSLTSVALKNVNGSIFLITPNPIVIINNMIHTNIGTLLTYLGFLLCTYPFNTSTIINIIKGKYINNNGLYLKA